VVEAKARLIIVLVIALAGEGMAQAIPRWRTPEGALYFGDSPPAGSKRIGEVGEAPSPGKTSGPSQPIATPDPEKADKASAYSACTAAGTQSLSVPGVIGPLNSAKFVGGSGQFRVEGYVDVTSAGGESVRFRYRCEVARESGEWKVQRFLFE
jgi:hypothetical protein